MKVFVSGQIEDKESVRIAYLKLEEAGCTITHDWTLTDSIGSISDNQSEAASRAVKDIRGVLDADMYILLSDNVHAGKGMYVELGTAIAAKETTGSLRVVTVGKRNHPSIFYFHPAVEHFDSLDELIQDIGKGRASAF